MMMQALTPPASFFFVRDFSGRESSQPPFKMCSSRWKAVIVLSLAGCIWSASIALCQEPKAGAAHTTALTPEKALALAQKGRCRESISALKRALTSQVASDTKKEIGVVGVRCSLAVDDRDSALDFIRFLHKQFPLDPDVLFVVTHAYSDFRLAPRKILAGTLRNPLPLIS